MDAAVKAAMESEVYVSKSGEVTARNTWKRRVVTQGWLEVDYRLYARGEDGVKAYLREFLLQE